MARCVAADDVELGTVAGIGFVAAGHADRAITMRQPDLAGLRIASDPESIGHADHRCVAVVVGDARERHRVGPGHRELALEFGFCGLERTRLRFVIGLRVAPLHDIVVLRTEDGEAVEIAFACECTDVHGMLRCQPGREFDHDTAAGEFQIQRVLRVGLAPVRRRGGSDDLVDRAIGRRFFGMRHDGSEGKQGQGES